MNITFTVEFIKMNKLSGLEIPATCGIPLHPPLRGTHPSTLLRAAPLHPPPRGSPPPCQQQLKSYQL